LSAKDAHNGVIWEQEIYESWSYNRENVRFHTFEVERCSAALSFANEEEAEYFYKMMNKRGSWKSKDIEIKDTQSIPFKQQAAEYPILDAFDARWRTRFGDDLIQMGIGPEAILENQGFIVEFLKSQIAERRPIEIH
jgi:hypothetical protein